MNNHIIFSMTDIGFNLYPTDFLVKLIIIVKSFLPNLTLKHNLVHLCKDQKQIYLLQSVSFFAPSFKQLLTSPFINIL